MGHRSKRGGTTLLAGSALLIAVSLGGPVRAQSDEPVKRPVPVHHPRSPARRRSEQPNIP